jgi:sporulation protein YlmC with PRC-barrel domain
VRATDLLGLRVYTREGTNIGAVQDLHITRRPDPLGDSGTPAYQVTAIEGGAVGVAHRLGYARGDVIGPWPISAVFVWFARRSWTVPWHDIETIDAHHITLAIDRNQLQQFEQDPA